MGGNCAAAGHWEGSLQKRKAAVASVAGFSLLRSSSTGPAGSYSGAAAGGLLPVSSSQSLPPSTPARPSPDTEDVELAEWMKRKVGHAFSSLLSSLLFSSLLSLLFLSLSLPLSLFALS